MTPARRSKAASVTPWSTPTAARFVLQVHSDLQDCAGAVPLLKASRKAFPFVERAFADSGYRAERASQATSIVIEVVKKSAGQVGFVVLPRRWLNRNRRLAKDFEATIASAEAFLYAASVMLLARRLAQS
jgi:transposase